MFCLAGNSKLLVWKKICLHPILLHKFYFFLLSCKFSRVYDKIQSPTRREKMKEGNLEEKWGKFRENTCQLSASLIKSS